MSDQAQADASTSTTPTSTSTDAAPASSAPSCACQAKLEQLARILVASGNLHNAGESAVRELFGFKQES